MIKVILIFLSVSLIVVDSNTIYSNKINNYEDKRSQVPAKFEKTYSIWDDSTKSNLTLRERIKLEKSQWHWFPYQRIDYYETETGEIKEIDCPKPSSIDDFPEDLFTKEQRLQGAIILHFLGAIYFFSILAVVCSEYFIPSVECICEDLKLTQDVAAATFMATATSTPEFFTNVISTFVAESDMGLGTIVGSMLFNTLGVGALAALAAPRPVQLDWWPLTRDCIIFSLNLSFLIGVAWDGRIEWYETIPFLVLYIVYFFIMFQNKRMMRFVKRFIEDKWGCCSGRGEYDTSVPTKAAPPTKKRLSEMMSEKITKPGEIEILATHVQLMEKEDDLSLWHFPSSESAFQIFWWIYSWPIKFALKFTIPSTKRFRRLYALTFILCIIWLGSTSYMIFWMITVIGETFSIPESVMGLIFLAAGGCLPEAVSAIIITRSGNGAMGVSNSLGANSLNILFSLGIPWFIKTMVQRSKGEEAFINIFSHGMQFTLVSLLFAAMALYLCVYLAGYRLKKLVGVALISFYLLFLSFALLVEFDIIFKDA